MNNRYVIDFELSSQLTAGPKARADVNTILQGIGYEVIKLIYSKKTPIRSYWSLLSILWKIRNKSSVLLQYPIGQIFPTGIVLRLLRFKGVKSTILVHDLESFRRNGKLSFLEIDNLNRADCVILHTSEMQKIVQFSGLHSSIKTKVLGVFDYLVKFPNVEKSPSAKSRIVFAGNLKKTHCVYSFEKTGASFNLYGTSSPHISNPNIKYKGCFSPEDISSLDGDWGLVWDGDSITTCNGSLGVYLRYNSPHKLSLYLAAGLPVIVWNQSAVRDFIIENNLGLAVETLVGIDRVLSMVSSQQYEEMKYCVRKVGQRIRNGEMLLNILE